ncbi:MAG TPA: sigma factor-like helix-turn-helix DNA-binding protein [Polyangiaceae bacterium]|nr:sigma factor-like helix-turn-helix DNA-binding protein [Polyangiaceae bacterium]
MRAADIHGVELLVQRTRRFPLVDECSHEDRAACRNTLCRYHLEHRGYGEHLLNPTRDCALDVANEGEHSTEEVASILGISRERVRQIEERALRKLQRIASLRRAHDDD